MSGHTGFHNKEHYSPDCSACKHLASLLPPWLIEYEKEQGDKWVVLKEQIDIKRDYAFAESLFGSLEHQVQMQAMVDTYDVVLKLIKDIGGK